MVWFVICLSCYLFIKNESSSIFNRSISNVQRIFDRNITTCFPTKQGMIHIPSSYTSYWTDTHRFRFSDQEKFRTLDFFGLLFMDILDLPFISFGFFYVPWDWGCGDHLKTQFLSTYGESAHAWVWSAKSSAINKLVIAMFSETWHLIINGIQQNMGAIMSRIGVRKDQVHDVTSLCVWVQI